MKEKSIGTSLGRLRSIAFLEGISFLLLLGIAMPLKYILGIPQAVIAAGWAHGLLFMLYMAALLEVTVRHRWSFRKVLLSALASVTPGGPFLLEARLLRHEKNAPADE